MSYLRLLLAVVLATGVVSAQRGGGGLTGAQETPLPTIGGVLTLPEQLNAKLSLDAKTQLEPVDQILVAASREAAPLGQQMDNLRKQLVNAELHNSPEDAKAVLAEYKTVAAKMAGIEAQAFAKIYALLKPNQQSKGAEAFTIMAGMFLPPAPSTRPAGRGGAGGGQRGGGR